ncbi:MAG: hypothetical protein QGI21_05325 [Candidatus Poseidoniaceae archaeon]|nr:hypothetical protein [Candidatus Poseidoniaceae archaeon]
MTDKAPEDEILSEDEFKRAAGVNLSNFIIDNPEEKPVEVIEPQSKESEEEIDEAIGEVANIFTKGDQPSRINRDGTVDDAEEMDTITDYAVHGEKRLHFGMMIAMIVTYSLIGVVAGIVFPPVAAAISLLALAGLGFWLGEIWIPKHKMHLLGVTWVIISMKLLYGFAISMNEWGWIDVNQLGPILLLLVGANITIAQRHNNDAIAAQATIVLLAIGSGAGAIYGEEGVAIMIGIGTLLMHGLAYFRTSGNLASLGIAVSYLWTGLHSISNEWVIGGMPIKSLEDPLLLFLLMFGITGINAVVAAKFAKEENWFSSAFKSLGLGKPGLWSVSVGLGMIGALLAIASHRGETGYSLAQIILLLSAFGPSYLVVRGVEWKKLQKYTLYPAPFLLALLILMEQQPQMQPPFAQSWSVYAAISTIITTVTLLNHQKAVSDHVLWSGSIVIVILLTLLIPAEEESGGRILLGSQLFVWIGLGALSIYRNSPSLAGTTVLAPLFWLIIFASDVENRIVSTDVIPIQISEIDLSIYLALMITISIPINLKLGDTGVNLASRLVGLSELGARVRDSGMMRLWNISFIGALITILSITRKDAISAPGLIIIMGILLISHSIIMRLDRHQGTPRTILVSWALSAIILQWWYGFGPFWIILFGISSLIIVSWAENNAVRKNAGEALSDRALMPGKLITLTLGFIALMMIIMGLDVSKPNLLNFTTDLPGEIDSVRLSAIAAFATIGSLYLPRAASFERLLPPAISSIAVIVTVGLVADSIDDQITKIASYGAFVITGSWLAAQGEIRSRAKQVTKREERMAEHAMKVSLTESVMKQQETSEETSSNIRIVDADMLLMAEKQKKRSRRRGSTGEYDLVVGDIHHNPVIVLSFLSVTILIACWYAWNAVDSLVVIALASFISVLFIGIARWRADQVNLRLPDMMGIESPIAITMIGITLIHIASRLGDVRVVADDQWGRLILLFTLVIMGGISLVGRKDLGLRIPSVLEGIVSLMLISRMLTTVMGNESGLIIDPDLYDSNSWLIPVWSIEAFFVIAVLLFEWVETERMKRGLGDHRGAAGRFVWSMLVVLCSSGIAGILACIVAIKNGIKWTQPAVLVSVAIISPFSWFALTGWIEIIESTTGWYSVILGFSGLFVAIWATISDNGLWIPPGLWIGHVLIISGLFGQYEASTVFLMVGIIIISTTSWLIGVVTLRRAWRVMGALDLVLAWIVSGFLILGGATSIMALIMLVSTAILLGLVTTIGQIYEEEIANT